MKSVQVNNKNSELNPYEKDLKFLIGACHDKGPLLSLSMSFVLAPPALASVSYNVQNVQCLLPCLVR